MANENLCSIPPTELLRRYGIPYKRTGPIVETRPIQNLTIHEQQENASSFGLGPLKKIKFNIKTPTFIVGSGNIYQVQVSGEVRQPTLKAEITAETPWLYHITLKEYDPKTGKTGDATDLPGWMEAVIIVWRTYYDAEGTVPGRSGYLVLTSDNFSSKVDLNLLQEGADSSIRFVRIEVYGVAKPPSTFQTAFEQVKSEVISDVAPFVKDGWLDALAEALANWGLVEAFVESVPEITSALYSISMLHGAIERAAIQSGASPDEAKSQADAIVSLKDVGAMLDDVAVLDAYSSLIRMPSALVFKLDGGKKDVVVPQMPLLDWSPTEWHVRGAASKTKVLTKSEVLAKMVTAVATAIALSSALAVAYGGDAALESEKDVWKTYVGALSDFTSKTSIPIFGTADQLLVAALSKTASTVASMTLSYVESIIKAGLGIEEVGKALAQIMTGLAKDGALAYVLPPEVATIYVLMESGWTFSVPFGIVDGTSTMPTSVLNTVMATFTNFGIKKLTAEANFLYAEDVVLGKVRIRGQRLPDGAIRVFVTAENVEALKKAAEKLGVLNPIVADASGQEHVLHGTLVGFVAKLPSYAKGIVALMLPEDLIENGSTIVEVGPEYALYFDGLEYEADIYPVLFGAESTVVHPNPEAKWVNEGGNINLVITKEGYTKVYGWNVAAYIVGRTSEGLTFYRVDLTDTYGIFNKLNAYNEPWLAVRPLSGEEAGDVAAVKLDPSNEPWLGVNGINVEQFMNKIASIVEAKKWAWGDVVAAIFTAVPRFATDPAIQSVDKFMPIYMWYSRDIPYVSSIARNKGATLIQAAVKLAGEVKRVGIEMIPLVFQAVRTSEGNVLFGVDVTDKPIIAWVNVPTGVSVLNVNVEVKFVDVNELAKIYNENKDKDGVGYVLDPRTNVPVAVAVPSDNNVTLYLPGAFQDYYAGLKVRFVDDAGDVLVRADLLADIVEDLKELMDLVKFEWGEKEGKAKPVFDPAVLMGHGWLAVASGDDVYFVNATGLKIKASHLFNLKQATNFLVYGPSALGLRYTTPEELAETGKSVMFDAKVLEEYVNKPVSVSALLLTVLYPDVPILLIQRILTDYQADVVEAGTLLATYSQELRDALTQLAYVRILTEPGSVIIGSADVRSGVLSIALAETSKINTAAVTVETPVGRYTRTFTIANALVQSAQAGVSVPLRDMAIMSLLANSQIGMLTIKDENGNATTVAAWVERFLDEARAKYGRANAVDVEAVRTTMIAKMIEAVNKANAWPTLGYMDWLLLTGAVPPITNVRVRVTPTALFKYEDGKWPSYEDGKFGTVAYEVPSESKDAVGEAPSGAFVFESPDELASEIFKVAVDQASKFVKGSVAEPLTTWIAWREFVTYKIEDETIVGWRSVDLGDALPIAIRWRAGPPSKDEFLAEAVKFGSIQGKLTSAGQTSSAVRVDARYVMPTADPSTAVLVERTYFTVAGDLLVPKLFYELDEMTINTWELLKFAVVGEAPTWSALVPLNDAIVGTIEVGNVEEAKIEGMKAVIPVGELVKPVPPIVAELPTAQIKIAPPTTEYEQVAFFVAVNQTGLAQGIAYAIKDEKTGEEVYLMNAYAVFTDGTTIRTYTKPVVVPLAGKTITMPKAFPEAALIVYVQNEVEQRSTLAGVSFSAPLVPKGVKVPVVLDFDREAIQDAGAVKVVELADNGFMIKVSDTWVIRLYKRSYEVTPTGKSFAFPYVVQYVLVPSVSATITESTSTSATTGKAYSVKTTYVEVNVEGAPDWLFAEGSDSRVAVRLRAYRPDGWEVGQWFGTIKSRTAYVKITEIYVEGVDKPTVKVEYAGFDDSVKDWFEKFTGDDVAYIPPRFETEIFVQVNDGGEWRSVRQYGPASAVLPNPEVDTSYDKDNKAIKVVVRSFGFTRRLTARAIAVYSPKGGVVVGDVCLTPIKSEATLTLTSDEGDVPDPLAMAVALLSADLLVDVRDVYTKFDGETVRGAVLRTGEWVALAERPGLVIEKSASDEAAKVLKAFYPGVGNVYEKASELANTLWSMSKIVLPKSVEAIVELAEKYGGATSTPTDDDLTALFGSSALAELDRATLEKLFSLYVGFAGAVHDAFGDWDVTEKFLADVVTTQENFNERYDVVEMWTVRDAVLYVYEALKKKYDVAPVLTTGLVYSGDYVLSATAPAYSLVDVLGVVEGDLGVVDVPKDVTSVKWKADGGDDVLKCLGVSPPKPKEVVPEEAAKEEKSTTPGIDLSFADNLPTADIQKKIADLVLKYTENDPTKNTVAAVLPYALAILVLLVK